MRARPVTNRRKRFETWRGGIVPLAGLVVALGLVTPPVSLGASGHRAGVPGQEPGARVFERVLELDNVVLRLRTPFLPAPDFVVAAPGDLTQVAVSTAWAPFRELTVTVIPYGFAAGTERLPVAEPGIAGLYRDILLDYRVQQEGDVGPGPVVRLFGQDVAGQASLVLLHLNSEALEPTVIVEWVVEAGERVWLVRGSGQVPPETAALGACSSFLHALEGLELASDTLDRPTTVDDPLDRAVAPGDLPEAAFFGERNATAEALPWPSWWDGNCDTNYYYANSGIYAYPLGGSYRGMPACGPRPAYGEGPDVVVYFYPGAWGEYEWECVELSMRYLYLAYGIGPYSANGSQVVWNYSGSELIKIGNGTPNAAPVPGDVLSYGSTSTWGHTSVVSASAVDSNGNGTITVVEQNASAGGVATLTVSGWYVSNSVSGWLHDPGSGTTPSASCPGNPSDLTCDRREPTAAGCANDAFTVDTATIVNAAGQTVGWVDLRYSNVCQSNWSRVRSNVGTTTLYAKAVREDGMTVRMLGNASTLWTNMIYAPSAAVKACGAVGTAYACTQAY